MRGRIYHLVHSMTATSHTTGTVQALIKAQNLATIPTDSVADFIAWQNENPDAIPQIYALAKRDLSTARDLVWLNRVDRIRAERKE